MKLSRDIFATRCAGPRVLTYGDLALIEWALASLAWDGGHRFISLGLAVLGFFNVVLHIGAAFGSQDDES